jgi:predicted membrane metal-binding protein
LAAPNPKPLRAVAVSGQNVALITVFVLVAFGLAGLIGTPARVAALVAAAAYTLVTGAGPSIVRAGVAGALVATAWIASQPVLRWHPWATSAYWSLRRRSVSSTRRRS